MVCIDWCTPFYEHVGGAVLIARVTSDLTDLIGFPREFLGVVLPVL